MSRTQLTDNAQLGAILGSRLFVTRAHSKAIGCLVIAGYDFPEAIKQQLLAWQTTLHLNMLQDRLSTRGLPEYQDDTFGRTSLALLMQSLKLTCAQRRSSTILQYR
jgi:hypothetical protein